MKMLQRAAQIAALVLAWSCASCAPQDSTPTDGASAMRVVPPTVALGDRFTVYFPADHPKALAIVAPDDQWYVLQSPVDDIWMLDGEGFEHAQSLEIDTGAVTATTWRQGERQVEPVFQGAGHYQLYMADNLETEPDNTFHFETSIEVTGAKD